MILHHYNHQPTVVFDPEKTLKLNELTTPAADGFAGTRAVLNAGVRRCFPVIH